MLTYIRCVDAFFALPQHFEARLCPWVHAGRGVDIPSRAMEKAHPAATFGSLTATGIKQSDVGEYSYPASWTPGCSGSSVCVLVLFLSNLDTMVVSVAQCTLHLRVRVHAGCRCLDDDRLHTCAGRHDPMGRLSC